MNFNNFCHLSCDIYYIYSLTLLNINPFSKIMMCFYTPYSRNSLLTAIVYCVEIREKRKIYNRHFTPNHYKVKREKTNLRQLLIIKA